MSQFSVVAIPTFVNKVPVTNPTSYPYLINENDYAIIVDTTEPRTILLPTAPITGSQFLIKDGLGMANANPITIDGNGFTIDSQPSYTIQVTYGGVTMLFNGVEYSVII